MLILYFNLWLFFFCPMLASMKSTASNDIPLAIAGKPKAFLMEKTGIFPDPEVLDFLCYRSGRL